MRFSLRATCRWQPQRCKKLILVCPPNLMPVMATLPGIGQIREAGAITVAEFDTYLPLLSLPRVFGTTPATIPATVPYIDIAMLRRRKDLDGPAESVLVSAAKSGSGVGRQPNLSQ